MSQLTVAIPTFDRPTDLEATLKRIGPQLNSQCILHVVDNCSQFDIERIVARFREEFSGIVVNYTRNQANIGASANFMRCFELCETPWIWLLSDDDIVADNAIKNVLGAIQQHSDCVYINFRTVDQPEAFRPSSLKVVGFDELVHKMEQFRDQIFISTSIYQTRPFKQYLNVGYHFAYSLVPMFAMLAIILSQNQSPCLLSQHSIVMAGPNKPDSQSWALLPLIMGIYSLLDLPMKRKTRVMLRKKIGSMVPSYAWVAFSLALQAKSIEGAAPTSIYSFLQYVDRRSGSSILSADRLYAKFFLVFFFIPKWQLLRIVSLFNTFGRGKHAMLLCSQTPFQRI